METINKVTESQMHERIWVAIAERRLPPGTRLKEERLCDIFGASRPRVRRALDQLAHDGLVDHIPNRGAFVATPTIADARDILYSRRVVERGILDAFIEKVTEQKLSTLRRHIDAERAALAAGDAAQLLRLSGRFHTLLAELAETPILSDILRDLVSKSTLVSAVFQPRADPQCGPDEHEEIVAAVQQRDTTAARTSMDTHLHEIEDKLKLGTAETESKVQTDVLSNALAAGG